MNTSLVHLDISHTNMTAAHGEQLRDALLDNKSLRGLHTAGLPFLPNAKGFIVPRPPKRQSNLAPPAARKQMLATAEKMLQERDRRHQIIIKRARARHMRVMRHIWRAASSFKHTVKKQHTLLKRAGLLNPSEGGGEEVGGMGGDGKGSRATSAAGSLRKANVADVLAAAERESLTAGSPSVSRPTSRSGRTTSRHGSTSGHTSEWGEDDDEVRVLEAVAAQAGDAADDLVSRTVGSISGVARQRRRSMASQTRSPPPMMRLGGMGGGGGGAGGGAGAGAGAGFGGNMGANAMMAALNSPPSSPDLLEGDNASPLGSESPFRSSLEMNAATEEVVRRPPRETFSDDRVSVDGPWWLVCIWCVISLSVCVLTVLGE